MLSIISHQVGTVYRFSLSVPTRIPTYDNTYEYKNFP